MQNFREHESFAETLCDFKQLVSILNYVFLLENKINIA